MAKCNCKDWEENIKILNSMAFMDAIHVWGQSGYTGKKFVFCPWCGNELIDVKKEYVKQAENQ